MADIYDIERKIHQKGYEPKQEDYDALIRHYYEIAAKNGKTRTDALKKCAYLVSEVSKLDSDDTEKLKWYIDVLEDSIKAVRSGPYIATLTKMKGKWLELSGDGPAEILKEKRTLADIDSGILAVGDPAFLTKLPQFDKIPDDELQRLADAGQVRYFPAEGAGKYTVTLRLVNSNEPVLKEGEYKYVFDASGTRELKNGTGVFRVADALNTDGKTGEVLDFEVREGEYKIAIFHVSVPGETEGYVGFIVVFCKKGNHETVTSLS
jgi:hypothetical protein